MKDLPGLEQTKKFAEDLKRCVDCGHCTLWCPIYEEEAVESSVARGKHMMIGALLAGEGSYNEEFSTLSDKCTLCMACTEHCPFKFQVQPTLIASRADRVKATGISLSAKFVHRWLIPKRILFGQVLKVASWLRRISFPESDARLRHLPLFLSGLGKGWQIPSLAPRFLRQIVPVINKPPAGVPTKMRVGYFTGCATEFIFPHVGERTIQFFTRHGVEVVVPQEQGCCGAPAWREMGDFDAGRKLADTHWAAFADLDYIVTACATCASALKGYARFLADTAEREKNYAAFAHRVKDLSEFLVDVLRLPEAAYRAAPEAEGKKITWHDLCHANRYLGVKEQPRQIIKSLPGVEYIEMIGADRCCGMGGAFGIRYDGLAKKIADKKAVNIKNTGAEIVGTSCPGCMIQLTEAVQRNQMDQKVRHIMELLR